MTKNAGQAAKNSSVPVRIASAGARQLSVLNDRDQLITVFERIAYVRLGYASRKWESYAVSFSRDELIKICEVVGIKAEDSK